VNAEAGSPPRALAAPRRDGYNLAPSIRAQGRIPSKDDTMARSQNKVMGPTRGRKRVHRMGMNSGRLVTKRKNKKPRRGFNP
jgi:hypothetical protein